MPSNYGGVAKAHATIDLPLGGELRNAASVGAPMQKLADMTRYSMGGLVAQFECVTAYVDAVRTQHLDGIGAGLIDEGFGTKAEAWVAVGEPVGVNPSVYVSRDGSRWEFFTVISQTVTLHSVAYDPVVHLWVAVGESNGVDALIITATDPRSTWTERNTNVNIALNSVASNGAGVFVAVGKATGGSSYIIRSVDGVTWSQQVSPVNYDLNHVIFANGIWVAVGGNVSNACVLTSTDGINWIQRTTAATKRIKAVAWNGNVFVAISADAPAEISYSTSGASWALRVGHGVLGADVAARSTIAADTAGPIILQSDASQGLMVSWDDGVTFTSMGNLQDPNDGGSIGYAHQIVFARNRFMAACEKTSIARGVRR